MFRILCSIKIRRQSHFWYWQISDFIPKKCKILKFRQNVWCILFLIKNNPYSQNLRRLHFAWAEIFAKTFVKYLLGKVPHKMENLQNFYHDWNQHKKLSSGFLIPSHLICNSRDIGHVLFPEGFLRMFFANISAHVKCRRLKFWLQGLFLMRNKMHQTFCRNFKILHFFGIKSEIYHYGTISKTISL